MTAGNIQPMLDPYSEALLRGNLDRLLNCGEPDVLREALRRTLIERDQSDSLANRLQAELDDVKAMSGYQYGLGYDDGYRASSASNPCVADDWGSVAAAPPTEEEAP